jgi:DNA-directed RNA polymerase specialized sigma24 family protein
MSWLPCAVCPGDREAMVLRYYGELSLGEIATAMQVSVGTVKSTLFKGTQRFAQMLEESK